MSEIKEGKYTAKIASVDFRDSGPGNRMVVIGWELDAGVKLNQYQVIEMKDGSRVERGIAHLRRMFPDWNGEDGAWFLENADRLEGLRAELTVAIGEYKGFPAPGVKYAKIIGKAPAPNRPPTSPAAIAETSDGGDGAENTWEGVWCEFCRAHADLDKPDLDQAWFALIDRVVGRDKDQLDFSPADWSRVSAAIREEVAK